MNLPDPLRQQVQEAILDSHHWREESLPAGAKRASQAVEQVLSEWLELAGCENTAADERNLADQNIDCPYSHIMHPDQGGVNLYRLTDPATRKEQS